MSLPMRLADDSPRRQERRGGDAPMPQAELAKLRRWLAHSAAAATQVDSATPSVFDALRIAPPQRREANRTAAEAAVLVRRIGACSIGGVEPATLHDVSESGVAIRVASPVEPGQRLDVEIGPPRGMPRRLFRRGERCVRLLVVARHCRPVGDAHLVGCVVGVELADCLADAMFPADAVRWRRSA